MNLDGDGVTAATTTTTVTTTTTTITTTTTTTTTSSSCVTDTANATIIVSGGHCHDSYNCKSVEVLEKDGSSLCEIPDFPDYRLKHSQSGLVACGGDGNMRTSCVTFNSGSWSLTHTLNCNRKLHSVWSSPSGIVLMGGHDDSCNKASEILVNTGNSQDSYGLKYQTRYHKVFTYYILSK